MQVFDILGEGLGEHLFTSPKFNQIITTLVYGREQFRAW